MHVRVKTEKLAFVSLNGFNLFVDEFEQVRRKCSLA